LKSGEYAAPCAMARCACFCAKTAIVEEGLRLLRLERNTRTAQAQVDTNVTATITSHHSGSM
jgi:hypothetical protein